ncbi:unnamed protein product [Microthlaspi erraticum]|uniref:Uncharacterized protein n=1 Tax=Microthlaspi erraticum TaxID=1685480 RepID=A0A6D2J411_9BRAS|nr:unnamed protein product [Microthlaspi erraticum]
MRIEGEKGVKTQSAPNIGRGRAKIFWPSNFQPGRPCGRAGKERLMLGRIDSIARQEPSRGTHGQRRNRPRSAGFMYRNGPTVTVDPGNKRSASAEILVHSRVWPTKSHDRDKIGHRPKTFLGQGKSPFH